MAIGSTGFDWKNIILNFISVLEIAGLVTAIAGFVIGPRLGWRCWGWEVVGCR
nr:hypothetical protein [Rubidibacter lacunae]